LDLAVFDKTSVFLIETEIGFVGWGIFVSLVQV
jgi:hypothetical protein